MAHVTKELSARVRKELKEKFPTAEGWKFSVRKDDSGTLYISILQGPMQLESGSINHRHIDNRYKGITKALFNSILAIANEGNYNNSDIMTDYFDVGWYINLAVGNYDREYTYVERESFAFQAEFATIDAAEKEEARQLHINFEAEQKIQSNQTLLTPNSTEAAADEIAEIMAEIEFNDTKVFCEQIAALPVIGLFPNMNKNENLALYEEQRKAGEYSENLCVVNEIAYLSNDYYDYFINHLFSNLEWLSKKGGGCNFDDLGEDAKLFKLLSKLTKEAYVINPVAVYSPNREPLLIDPSGYNYARYVAYMPAKFQKAFKKVAKSNLMAV